MKSYTRTKWLLSGLLMISLGIVQQILPLFAQDITSTSASKTIPLEDLQRQFTELRFGAFVHFNMSTFTDEEWATPNQDVKKFDPEKLDCNQWARAFKAAGMRFAVLTTKHHDGFCLWDTKMTSYNSMNSPVHRDVLREFVDAMRSNGIQPAIYFSMWDRTQGIDGKLSRKQIDFVKGEITELLTNYGEVPIFIIDGWAWRMGHQNAPYQEIRELIKKLQPNCLICDHNGQHEPWDDDVIYFEEPKGVWCPPGNTYCSVQGQTISGGWFWHPDVPTKNLMGKDDIVDHLNKLQARYCNFMLNCPPNRDGVYDDNIVKRLAEVGEAWRPDLSRPPLPPQPHLLEHPITPKSAEATSGNAHNAIDGINDVNNGGAIAETLWKSDPGFPQSVTINLGKTYNNVEMVTYLPPQSGGETAGYITSYKILASTDGQDFVPISMGTWDANSHFKTAEFRPVIAHYIRLEAEDATGGFACANEIGVGGRLDKPESTDSNAADFDDESHSVLSAQDGVIGVKSTKKGEATVFSQASDCGEGQTASSAVDGDTNTKYYNRAQDGSLTPGVNTGLIVVPKKGAAVVTGIEFSTGGDMPQRDPMTCTIEGSNDGNALSNPAVDFNLIYEGKTGLDDDPGRNNTGNFITFSNTNAYKIYRILITGTRDKDSDGVQYSEVQLFKASASTQ
jgi:alpha-L-fucosidase